MVTYIVIAVIIVVAAIFFYRKKREKEMLAGLQIFNESQKLIFDLSKNTTYILGEVNTNGESSGVVNDERIKGTVWVAITAKGIENAKIPIFEVTDGKIKWKYSVYGGGAIDNITFIYGRV